LLYDLLSVLFGLEFGIAAKVSGKHAKGLWVNFWQFFSFVH
jgi:hypothetical protein